jgi:uncharacterized protein (DUF924 family)
MLIAKLLATLPTLNAMTPPDNARHATEPQTRTVPKLKLPAKLDASTLITLNLFATRPMENAENVTHNTVERDAFQRANANPNANQAQNQKKNMNANGKLIHQNAKNLLLVPTLKKNAMMHARNLNSLNATSRTTNALTARLVKTPTAFSPKTIARSSNKEENASQRL